MRAAEYLYVIVCLALICRSLYSAHRLGHSSGWRSRLSGAIPGLLAYMGLMRAMRPEHDGWSMALEVSALVLVLVGDIFRPTVGR
jgi:hypothetical protein